MMMIRSDNCDGMCLKIFTNPTVDDFFIATYYEKDGYNGFTTPTVKICGPGGGGGPDIPEDIKPLLLKVLSRLSEN
jgi:hypothetical protein